jgi:hypothetical protein
MNFLNWVFLQLFLFLINLTFHMSRKLRIMTFYVAIPEMFREFWEIEIGHQIFSSEVLVLFQANTTHSVECHSCPDGHFCVKIGESEICPMGYFCPKGTGIGIRPCPPGTFSNETGLSHEVECRQCTAGMYCDGVHLSQPSGN